ncbi:unnamed protein product [Chilo suppressalis]|uniref:26S proteasome non-ATPase regulatory subunit 5 n=1 Tax=Chilo suppressalis TaxID=168631 RepID=A0ABN8BH02_CHISP|nr:hypothetical protein evm_001200 [Chilo suppressalis]CAH0407424.1 unnamed protein product [Chilo suppressalis]
MSGQDSEHFRAFLNQLQREEHRPVALNELKNLLVLKPAGEARSTIRDAGISKIVQCLNASEKILLDLACEVLKICFEKFPPGEIVTNYTGHVMYLLRHEKSCVRKLAIEEVHKAVKQDINLLPVPQYIDVFVAIAQLVGDPDIGVANKAIHITSNLLPEAYQKVLEEMKIILEYSGSSKCNAYEVIIEISTKSYELFQLSVGYGYIDQIITDLTTNDVLLQLNLIELLARLAIKPHGINYLVKQGVLKKITDFAIDLPNNPCGGLLVPGYLKFFGCIAHFYPRDIFEKYPELVELLFDTLENGDQTVLPVALDTFGFIGRTVEGKLCLAAFGSKYTQAVDGLSQLIKSSTTDIKVRALNCFANLISVESDPNSQSNSPVDHRVTLMTREWFRSLSYRPNSMEYLFDMCKNPFPDIRLGAFALLDAVCQHRWGEELVATTAGFIEYLLDRSIDHTKESKELKYDIIRRLSNSAAFDANIITRLQTYVEKGPFYSEDTLEVAMEDGD